LKFSAAYQFQRASWYVRFGSFADICSATEHVRFTPDSDRESRHAAKVMSARMLRQCNDVRAARKRRLLSIQIDEFFEYLKSIKLAVAQTAAPIRPKKVTMRSAKDRHDQIGLG
jgi:hypothetical protein